ncbi:MAG: hypothetical protein LBK99_22550 [Opitutaceae bacterium]|jgi:hypothetical protein|nr:hypothetical protein [Opitutaceae bacterium]
MNSFKKHSLFVGVATLACALSAPAALLVEETFTYPDGNLYNKSGGSGFSENWWGGTNGTGVWTVNNSAAKISGINSTWAVRGVSPAGTDFFFSVDLTVDTLATLASGSFVDALILRVGGLTFYVGAQFTQWGYGIRATIGSDNYSLTPSQAIKTTGTTYTIVGHYTFSESAGQAAISLWLNPENETSPALHEVSPTATSTGLDRITLQRYDSDKGGTTTTIFDNIRIGTEWGDVAPSPVPEPEAWTAIAGAVLFVLASLRCLRCLRRGSRCRT